MWPTNNRWSFHLSLGGWSLSHTLFTLYNICMTKKYDKFFLMSKQQFSTPARQIFHIPDHWDVGCSPCCLCWWTRRRCSCFSDCEGLCQCLRVRLHTCPCIHNLPQSVSYFNTTECSSYTQRGGERSLNASSWSNGTTLDYNCQEWQLEKRTKTWPNSETNYFTVSTQKCFKFLFKRYKIKRYE